MGTRSRIDLCDLCQDAAGRAGGGRLNGSGKRPQLAKLATSSSRLQARKRWSPRSGDSFRGRRGSNPEQVAALWGERAECLC